MTTASNCRAAARLGGRRLGTLTALVALGVLALVQPAHAAPVPLHVSLGGGATFPTQSIVLSIPARRDLSPSQVHVTENGAAVADETVNPIRLAPAGDFGVVLAIDNGPSMRGAAIDQAMAAARAIAAQRTAAQEMGLVLFDQAPTTKLALTQDPLAIQQALAQPPALGGASTHPTAVGRKATHIYDGVQLALQQLSAAHIAAGAVIVLSNGADQGSQVPPQTISTVAATGHIRIFTVGLRNRYFRPQTLRALAKIGAGSFTEADPSQLRAIFTRIESDLTSKYVIHYRSLQPYTSPIQVAVGVDGLAGTGTTSYTSPAAPPLANAAPGPRPGGSKPFWESSIALVLAASAGGLLLGLSLLFVLVPLVRRTGVRSRIGDFVAGPNAYGAQLSAELAAPRAAGRTERALERSPWWARFKEEVEIARIPRTPIQIVQITAGGTIVAATLLFLLVGSPLVILAVVAIGPLIMRGVVRQRLTAQRRLFADQLSGHLQEVASAMRSGHSIVGGFRVMAESASEPTHGEFRRALADEELGVPLDEAMLPIARRMASSDIEQVSLIISLHRRAGGNVAEVLDRVAGSVRERAELRRELHSLTAQARLSRWIVTGLPPALLLFLSISNPGYIRPLFNTPAGVVLLVIAGAMVVLGSLVMRKIVDIEP